MTGADPARDIALAALPMTAGSYLVEAVPRARAGDSAEAVRAALVGQNFAAAESVYVVDALGRLQGIVPIEALLAAPASAPLQSLMKAPPPAIAASEDQEQVALTAIRHGLAAVPVLDSERRLIGVVPAAALMAILRHEHVEDLHRIAGIWQQSQIALFALESSPLKRVLARLPWLIVGLVGSIVATTVMATFERLFEARIAVAFFVPAIVYLADAIGTQTEAVAVRALSFTQTGLWKHLLGELGTGMIIGIVLGALAFPLVLAGFSDAWLAAAVALALIGAGTLASGVGLAFPWLLARLGMDAAYGSGPLGTIVQDVLSLLIYFVLVSLLIV